MLGFFNLSFQRLVEAEWRWVLCLSVQCFFVFVLLLSLLLLPRFKLELILNSNRQNHNQGHVKMAHRCVKFHAYCWRDNWTLIFSSPHPLWSCIKVKVTRTMSCKLTSANEGQWWIELKICCNSFAANDSLNDSNTQNGKEKPHPHWNTGSSKEEEEQQQCSTNKLEQTNETFFSKNAGLDFNTTASTLISGDSGVPVTSCRMAFTIRTCEKRSKEGSTKTKIEDGKMMSFT